MLLICGTSILSSPAAAVHVHGYVTKNGTVVAPYERRAPHHKGKMVDQGGEASVRPTVSPHPETPPAPARTPSQESIIQHPLRGTAKIFESEAGRAIRGYVRRAMTGAKASPSAPFYRPETKPPAPELIDQSDLLTGTWQLNLAKSKYHPGPPPKSGTLNVQGEGQNRRLTAVAIDAEGNPAAVEFMLIYDGKPYPATGAPGYDASAYTRVDAHTVDFSLTKAGGVVQTGTNVVSPDRKTMTVTTIGTGANEPQINNIAVYDKQ